MHIYLIVLKTLRVLTARAKVHKMCTLGYPTLSSSYICLFMMIHEMMGNPSNSVSDDIHKFLLCSINTAQLLKPLPLPSCVRKLWETLLWLQALGFYYNCTCSCRPTNAQHMQTWYSQWHIQPALKGTCHHDAEMIDTHSFRFWVCILCLPILRGLLFSDLTQMERLLWER